MITKSVIGLVYWVVLAPKYDSIYIFYYFQELKYELKLLKERVEHMQNNLPSRLPTQPQTPHTRYFLGQKEKKVFVSCDPTDLAKKRLSPIFQWF